MIFIKKNMLSIAGIVFGSLAGYLYWKFIGCDSGGCAITADPLRSTIYGALMGGLFLSIFKK